MLTDPIVQSQSLGTYDEELVEVLGGRVSWKMYESIGITPRESGMLEDFGGQDETEGRADLLDEQGAQYTKLFMKCLKVISSPMPTKVILAWVERMLHQDRKWAGLFRSLEEQPYTDLLRLLDDEGDGFIVEGAARILGILLSGHNDNPDETRSFYTWINGKLTTPDHQIMPALSALKEFLKAPASQELFANRGGLFGLLTLTSRLEEENQNEQLLYSACFCIWLLSYNQSLLDKLDQLQVTKRLVAVVKSVLREKVVRVCLSSLLNFVDKLSFNTKMVSHGLTKTLEILVARKWKDEDIIKDVHFLEKRLHEVVEDLSSFEMYEAEVQVGALSWTPVHSTPFWRDNYPKFNKNNFALIKKLIFLLDPVAASSSLVCEVACYDLGEFARFHPDGKLTIHRFGGKTRLMQQMSSGDSAVAGQALLAVQKLMVANWELLQGGGGLSALATPGS